MKLYYSPSRISNGPRINEARLDGKNVSLQRVKAVALSASASHVSPPAREAVQDFGFFPKDVQGVIVRWPSL
jgi:hypothetical protein